MPLTPDDAVDAAREAKARHDDERVKLDKVRRYWKGRQKLPAVIPSAAPSEVRVMARIARVNVIDIVVDALAQSTFVDGFRAHGDDADAAVWRIWQANKLDARQTGIHRAAFAYHASYAVVLPGDPVPVIRGVSPRKMTALYDIDPDWPVVALERRPLGGWRLYDNEAVYTLRNGDNGKLEYAGMSTHGLGVCPVVRFVDSDDLDADDDVDSDRVVGYGGAVDMLGQVAPLMPVQDQIDLTTFGLLVAQHYSAFRQRYILGWIADTEEQKMKASASQLWTFDEHPSDITIGELGETSLKGYIESRQASIRHAATLSQTPVHELIGELVNLSAEALAAAEAGRDRKVDERKTLLGESWEQTLRLAAGISGIDVPDDAQVVWRDTSARAFGALVDGLGKLTQMLGIPPTELWEHLVGTAGITRADVERWKETADGGDVFNRLIDELDRQGAPVDL